MVIGTINWVGNKKSLCEKSKLPRYVKPDRDNYFDKEDAEVLRFDSFDDD
ncbi:hypothetical protein ACLBOM_37575 [Escherichia coli]